MEKRLPLEYYRRIEEAYKRMYLPKARDRGVNVIELDWTDPIAMDLVSIILLYLRYYFRACNKWLGPSMRLCAWKRSWEETLHRLRCIGTYLVQ